MCIFSLKFDSPVRSLQHAYALSILSDQLIDGARALDVGSGSGYLSACMAFMVGPRGRVIGVEHIPELIEISTRNVREDNPHFLKEGRIKFVGKPTVLTRSVLYPHLCQTQVQALPSSMFVPFSHTCHYHDTKLNLSSYSRQKKNVQDHQVLRICIVRKKILVTHPCGVGMYVAVKNRTEHCPPTMWLCCKGNR